MRWKDEKATLRFTLVNQRQLKIKKNTPYKLV